MKYLDGSEIIEALQKTYRVYLCGNLEKPQKELKWIHDEQLEIGISHYQDFTADSPHLHTDATEYNYVIKGSSKVLILAEEREYVFASGSLFVIPQNTKYASKHSADTQILFIKSPGGNDKQLIDVSPKLQTWLQSWNG